MPSGAVRLPGAAALTAAAGRCRHRRAVMDGRAPPTRQPERGWASPAAGGRGRRGCPDAGHAIGRLSASAVRRADVCPLGRADVRCPTRPVSTRPVSTRPARSWCPDGHASGDRGPGVRAVRIALDPGMRRCGGAAHVRARRVRSVAVVGEWLGRRCPNWGLAGKGWSWVRLCLAPTGSTADRPPVWIRGGCGVALAAGPTWELVQRRVPVGWLGARAGAAAHTSPCRCVLDRLPE
jgi:hypothetical protein